MQIIPSKPEVPVSNSEVGSSFEPEYNKRKSPLKHDLVLQFHKRKAAYRPIAASDAPTPL